MKQFLLGLGLLAAAAHGTAAQSRPRVSFDGNLGMARGMGGRYGARALAGVGGSIYVTGIGHPELLIGISGERLANAFSSADCVLTNPGGFALTCRQDFPGVSGYLIEVGRRRAFTAQETVDFVGGVGAYQAIRANEIPRAFALSVGANGVGALGHGIGVMLTAKIIVLPNVAGRVLVIAPLAAGFRIAP